MILHSSMGVPFCFTKTEMFVICDSHGRGLSQMGYVQSLLCQAAMSTVHVDCG